MSISRFPILGLTALLALSACGNTGLDWDLRGGKGALDTSDAALKSTGQRPAADGRGVISYPGYQVAVARRGDTVGSVAARIGMPADQLAKYNALQPGDALRDGEVLALPGRVAAKPDAGNTGGVIGGTAPSGAIDVSTIATTAIDRAATTAPAKAGGVVRAASGAEPTRHKVARGETAFSIARSYNVSAKSLADWNGLGADLAVREGQYLIIPTASGVQPAAVVKEATPGAGSATPTPPSAKKPLPDEKVAPASEKPKAEPASPDLSATRTKSSAFAMPVQGKIIRGYAKGKNDGIDIAASAGSPVKAAADGTVAAVTKDTTGTPIVVIRHDAGMLTVYAGVDGLKVNKGDKVSRGQTIAAIRPGNPAFVHFEVRKGVDSVDPVGFLQ